MIEWSNPHRLSSSRLGKRTGDFGVSEEEHCAVDPALSPELVKSESGRNSLFSPLKSRNFTALWGGQTFSQFGDNILMVALPLTVYDIDKSTMQMGLVFAFLMFPMVILLPLAGIIVDRVSRTFLMISTDIVRFLLMAAAAMLAFTGQLTLPLIDAIVVVFGACSALFEPAYAATRAQVFTADIRNAANGLTQVSQQGTRLIGPAVGGVAIGLVGPGAGFGIDAVTFLISVLSLTLLRFDEMKRTDAAKKSGALQKFIHEMQGGVRELKKSTWLWITILAFAVINIEATGVETILLPWLVKVHLHQSATVYGIVSSAAGFGAIVSAILYGRRKHWQHRGWMAYIGTAVSVAAQFALAFSRSEAMLIVVMAVASAGTTVFALTWEVSMQELVAPEAYGRVSSLDLFGSFALLPVGSILTGFVSAKIGGIATIEVETLAALAVVVGVLMIPAIRRFD